MSFAGCIHRFSLSGAMTYPILSDIRTNEARISQDFGCHLTCTAATNFSPSNNHATIAINSSSMVLPGYNHSSQQRRSVLICTVSHHTDPRKCQDSPSHTPMTETLAGDSSKQIISPRPMPIIITLVSFLHD